MANIEYALMIKPMPGETVSGDFAWSKKFDHHQLFCLIDVAGHGNQAHDIVKQCIPVLEAYYRKQLDDIIHELENVVKGSRGIVVGLALIDIQTGMLDYVGIGNIKTRILGKQEYHFVSRTGVLGVTKPHPVKESYLLNHHDVLLMYTDGIQDRFRSQDLPYSINGAPVDLSIKDIFTQFAKHTDDAGCILARYIGD